jgi:hypothetical protein
MASCRAKVGTFHGRTASRCVVSNRLSHIAAINRVIIKPDSNAHFVLPLLLDLCTFIINLRVDRPIAALGTDAP